MVQKATNNNDDINQQFIPSEIDYCILSTHGNSYITFAGDTRVMCDMFSSAWGRSCGW